MDVPDSADDWTALTDEPLPIDVVSSWVVRPDCGGVVTFSGTVRDHSEGRPGVSSLTYEAFAEEVVPRLDAIVAEARRRWPSIGRMALIHRVGELRVQESAVVVAVSAGHRGEAFEAARFGIDTLKHTIPIWKKETWEGGSEWSEGCEHVSSVPDSSAESASSS